MATILVVDDQSVSRECTATLLRASGYDVFRAANGSEALELLDNCPADLALVDVVMPEMDGLELLALLRSRPGWETKPVMFITGLLEPEMKQRGESLGANDWMIKSRFSPQQLIDRIEQNLGASMIVA